jgi:hypothetical protein
MCNFPNICHRSTKAGLRKVQSPPTLLPEFFALLGIDLFLLLSLLTCLLDDRFPKAIPYVYQIAALAGFGHLIISKEFMIVFGEYMRFWYCFFYLVVALANIVAVNVYLGIVKKLLNYARVFMLTVTLPALSLAVLFLLNYAETTVNPPIMVPQLFGQDALIAIVALGTFMVGLAASVFFKPKSWYIALGAGTIVTSTSLYALFKPAWGEAAFIMLVIALPTACAITGIGVGHLERKKNGGETIK